MGRNWVLEFMQELAVSRNIRFIRKDIRNAFYTLQDMHQPWAQKFLKKVCKDLPGSLQDVKLDRWIYNLIHYRPSKQPWEDTVLAALRAEKSIRTAY